MQFTTAYLDASLRDIVASQDSVDASRVSRDGVGQTAGAQEPQGRNDDKVGSV